MQPMNYKIDTGNVSNAFAQGFQNTSGMMASVAEYQKAQALATAQQQANEQAAYKRQRFSEVANNPSSKEVRRLYMEFPELHEASGKILEHMTKEEQRTTQNLAFSVTHALKKGNIDAAMAILDQQIEAAKNSGNDEAAQGAEMLRNSLEVNPKVTEAQIQGMLFSTMGKDYAEIEKKLEEAETERLTRDGTVRKGAAEATTKEAEAQYAGEKTRVDIADKRSTIEDRKFDQRIKAMEVSLSKETNELKRQELQIKIDDAKRTRDEAQRGKVAEVEGARSSIDNFINTADRLINNPMLSRVLGSVEGRFTSAPLSDEAADAIALIDTLKSQAFLSQIPSMKGTGALSEKEGAKLESSLTNLSRVQSEKQFMANLEEAKRILLKARATQAAKLGVPDDKQPAPSVDPLERLMQKYAK